MTRKRRFFSGPSLEAALVAAGNEYGLAPERVQYRAIEKKHGFLKIRRNVVIEVDPENPEKPAEEKKAKKAARKVEAKEQRTEAVSEAPEGEEEREEEASGPEGAASEDEEEDATDDREDSEDEDGAEDDGDVEDREEGGEEEDEDGEDGPEPPDLEFADEEDERAYRAVMRGEELPPLRSRKRGDDKGRGGRQSKGRQEKSRDRSRDKGRDKGREKGRERGRDKGRQDRRGRGRKDEGQKKAARSRSEGGQRERSRKPRDKKGPETETRSISRREPKDLQPIEKRLKKGRGEKADAALEASEWLLDLVDLDVDCQVYEGDERFEVEFRGRDRKFLVADSGKVLSALEHLIPRVMRGICGEGYPIRTDSENFQEMREERLKDEALETAARVRREGEPAILDAMDPADRRIVHITLTDDPEVTTRSLGDGYFKRVKILPK